MAQAKWVNKRSIMEDLSLTQGKVQIDAGHTIGITDNEKPPIQLITEETEEEYFGDCLGHGVSCEPDYEAIQRYLTMVNDVGTGEEAAEVTEEHVQNLELTKAPILTPLSKKNYVNDNKISEKQAELLTKELKNTIKQGRKDKNVAIASILKVYAGFAPVGYRAPETPEFKLLTPEKKLVAQEVKLLTPENKLLTHKVKLLTLENKLLTHKVKLLTPENKLLTQEVKLQTPELKLLKHTGSTEQKVEKNINVEVKTNIPKESIQKVTMWMDGERKADTVLFPKNIFKKKISVLSPPSTPSTKNSSPKTTVNDGNVTPIPRVKCYEPTAAAEELYKIYKANSDMQEVAKENVWTLAEKKMEAKDLKTLQEQERKDSEELARLADQIQRDEERTLQVIVLDTGVEITLPGAVCLPQARHSLTGTCLVCEVLCDKGQAARPDEQ